MTQGSAPPVSSRIPVSRRLRRAVAALAFLGSFSLLGCCPLRQLGGASSHRPEEAASGLSPAARALVARSYEGIDPQRLADYHTHVAGLGAGGTGCAVNPRMRSWLHPVERLRFAVYCSAAGIRHRERADAEFVDRLIALIQGMPGRGTHHLLALDWHDRPDGAVDESRTEFYVPNEYVFALAERHPDLFRPVMSVHPYRPDALAELERWAGKGGRIVKWLPNALIQTRRLVKAGYLTSEERRALNEIYDYNPLLFDFVLKRTLRAPGGGERFAARVFLENPGLR